MNEPMNNIEPVSEEEFDRELGLLNLKHAIRHGQYEMPGQLAAALGSDRMAEDLAGSLDSAMPEPAWGVTDRSAGPEAKGRAHTPRSLN